jgi:UDP-N-acetylmuramoyl-L-alanyl-D-glutamate--2,6-diaminopimelate ligase
LLSQTIPDGRWFLGDEPRVRSCCCVADQCQPGDLFVVLDERNLASSRHVELAMERGAIGILAERPFPNPIPQYLVDDSRAAFGLLCHALAGAPSQSLRTVGITGTYGKRATEHLLSSILSAAAQPHASVDAEQIGRGGAMQVARWLAESRASGCQYALLEASSQSLARRQLSGVALDAAVITNIRREHAEWHGSLKNYQAAKLRLLDQLKPGGLTVLNVDDAVSRALTSQLDGPVITVGMNEPAELTATLLERQASEQMFLCDAGDESIVVRTRVIGDGHIYNCLSAAAVALSWGLDSATIVRGIESVTTVPNRLQRVECGQSFGVFVDAAHTPRSLGNVLQTLRSVCSGSLHCLLGADHRLPEITRAELGRYLERFTDAAILTGTRFDRKMSLRSAHEILDGFDRPAQAHVMPDRAKAICWTLSQAKPGDVVLLAGGAESCGPDDVLLCDEDVTRYWLQHADCPSYCPWVPA